MKDKLTIISDDLNHDIISELEARKQLFILLGVVCSATKCRWLKKLLWVTFSIRCVAFRYAIYTVLPALRIN